MLEKGKLRASLSRSSNPSSDGELLDTTRLILDGTHKFSEKLRTSLTISWSNAETISRVSSDVRKTDEDLFRIRPKLFWKWHRDWQLAAEYEYVEKEDKDRNSDTARRNAFYLTLSYQPTKISISR